MVVLCAGKSVFLEVKHEIVTVASDSQWSLLIARY